MTVDLGHVEWELGAFGRSICIYAEYCIVKIYYQFFIWSPTYQMLLLPIYWS